MRLTLLINCPDCNNIVHSVTGFISENGGNIIYLDQHVDQECNVFFMRVQGDFDASKIAWQTFKSGFSERLGIPFKMKWDVYVDDYRPKMAVFASKYKHCLYDLLSRHISGELTADISFIVSNHRDLEPVAQQFNIPFYYVPVDKSSKKTAEIEHLRLLASHGVDFIVLARYMQIIGPDMIRKYPNKIINIHHSFLPAFAGARPYHAAFERGVKIIGATSHYVTEELDAGPIIEQDVTTVSHSHSISDFITKGRDLEKIVLARAVKLHIARKVMTYNNKTVIFS